MQAKTTLAAASIAVCYSGVMNRSLEFLSLVYLEVPWLIFCLAYLRPGIGIPLALGLCIYTAKERPGSSAPIRWRQCASILLVTLLWAGFSGAGGHGVQRSDWGKHNRILSDLIEHAWPVAYPEGSTLVYYIAYYLPAAAVGKLAGWVPAQHTVFLFTLAGIALALAWVARHNVTRPALAVVLFPLLSGLDYLGQWLVGSQPPVLGTHLENWAQIMAQYSSNATLLIWVPQHALAGWIATGLVLAGIGNGTSRRLPVIWSLTLLWSPFVALGLLPFVAFALLREGQGLRAMLPELALGAVCAGIVACYFLSSRGGNHIFEFYPQLQRIFGSVHFVLFCGFEFLLFFALTIPLQERKTTWAIWGMALGVLLLLPLVRYGINNDLVMRSSIPALFVMWMFTLRGLCACSIRTSGILQAGRIILIGIGSLTAVSELYTSTFMLWDPVIPDKQRFQTIFTLRPESRIQQYLGDPQSIFNRWFGRTR